VNTMLNAIPDERKPMAVPRFSGGKTELATTGVGIHTHAPPKPEQNIPTASTGALGATAERTCPPTAMSRPAFIMVMRRIRDEAIATASVPTKYAATLAVASEPAIVFDRPRSERIAGSTTPRVKRPKPWATPALAAASATTNQARAVTPKGYQRSGFLGVYVGAVNRRLTRPCPITRKAAKWCPSCITSAGVASGGSDGDQYRSRHRLKGF